MSQEEIRQEYEVLERSKSDVRAFGQLYEKYFARIFTFIYRQTDDKELTADLCSQVFLIALKHLHRFEYRGVPVCAWFYKIAANEVNKHYRKKKQSKVFSLEEGRFRDLIDSENEGFDDEMIDRLLRFMKDLPDDMLQVLQLRFYEDRDFKEIAFILDMTESGAKMRTYRALDRLRRNFNLRIRYDGQQ